MKHSKLFVVFLFLICISFLSSVYAQNQIRITLHQPPPNQLSAKDLWKMTLENTTGSPIEIYLEGFGEEQREGRIVDGRSPVFTLPAGRSNYNYESFKSGSVSWKNRTYEEFIVRTGTVPAGSYTTCVTAYSTEGVILGMEKCITQVISRGPEAEIILISPGYNEQVENEYPTFIWQTTAPITGAFKIKIVEILGDQSPENAIKGNKAMYEKDSLPRPMFQYPSSAPKLIPGKKYAWAVQMGENISEVNSFFVTSGSKGNEKNSITLLSPLNGEIIDLAKPLTFSWTSIPNVKSYKIKIVEILGDQSPENAIKGNKAMYEKDSLPRPMFQYPVNAPRLIPEKMYAWGVTINDHPIIGDWDGDGRTFKVKDSADDNAMTKNLEITHPPEDPVSSALTHACVTSTARGTQCFTTDRFNCTRFWEIYEYMQHIVTPGLGPRYTLLGGSCWEDLVTNNNNSVNSIVHDVNGLGLITTNDQTYPIISDKSYEILLKLENSSTKINEQDVNLFFENINGPVSKERMEEYSKILGVPVTYVSNVNENNSPFPRDRSQLAFSWKEDYRVDRTDILDYFQTKELMIKKGDYYYDYSNNPNGDIAFILSKPIKDKRIKNKVSIIPCEPYNEACNYDGQICFGIPMNARKWKLDIKGVGQDGLIREIIFRGVGDKTQGEIDNENYTNRFPDIDITITITCDIGRAKYDCLEGLGLCNCRLSLLPIENSGNSRAREMKMGLSGNNLFVQFKEPLPEDATSFTFDEPTVLPSSISKELGHERITIQAGEYRMEKMKNSAIVKLNVIVK